MSKLCKKCDRPVGQRGAKGLCHKHYESYRYHLLGASETARRREKYAVMTPEQRVVYRAQQQAWRDANRESVRAKGREYSKKHREKHAAYYKVYRAKNHEKLHLKMLQRKLGMEAETYLTLHKSQKGLCAICKQPEPDRRRIRLAVDHYHASGAIRGLLCSKCNRALGLFDDRPELLKTAAKYLQRSTNRR